MGKRWNRFHVPGCWHELRAFGKRYEPTLTIANTSSKNEAQHLQRCLYLIASL
ncbi:MAG: hypothetical protein IKP37_09010 [Paludibacteraceae bacterium]|nr:hypothetical protein [Paludibacteraceae bacterium]